MAAAPGNVVDSELFQIYAVYEGQRRGVGTAFAQDATQSNAFTKLTRYQSFLLRKLHLAERDLPALKAQSAQAVPIANTAVNCESELAVRKTVVVSASHTREPKLIEDHAAALETNAGG